MAARPDEPSGGKLSRIVRQRGRTKFNAALGVATVLPGPLWLALFITAFTVLPEDYEPPLLLGFAVVLVWGAAVFGPLGFLIWDASTNERLSPTQRTQWILVLLLLAIFTMPAYWWEHRWRAGGTVRSAA